MIRLEYYLEKICFSHTIWKRSVKASRKLMCKQAGKHSGKSRWNNNVGYSWGKACGNVEQTTSWKKNEWLHTSGHWWGTQLENSTGQHRSGTRPGHISIRKLAIPHWALMENTSREHALRNTSNPFKQSLFWGID